mgnify:CR=1 FL=1
MPYYRDYDYEDARDDARTAAADYARDERLEELREEYPDADDDELEELLAEQEADYCGCSDPGCPCDGFKRGGPP